MSTTPSGSPVWVRNADASTYGGSPEKRDYQSQGVVNPKTDVSAADFLRLTADVAAMARTTPFATVSVSTTDISSTISVSSVHQMTGVNTVGYTGGSPPSGMPTAVRNGTGDITLTWDAAYADEFGVSADLVITGAVPTVVNSTSGYAVYELLSDTSVRVRCFNSAGAALADAAVTVAIYT
jgi:hypothetical protein